MIMQRIYGLYKQGDLVVIVVEYYSVNNMVLIVSVGGTRFKWVGFLQNIYKEKL
jgi:hypothetical protein